MLFIFICLNGCIILSFFLVVKSLYHPGYQAMHMWRLVDLPTLTAVSTRKVKHCHLVVHFNYLVFENLTYYSCSPKIILNTGRVDLVPYFTLICSICLHLIVCILIYWQILFLTTSKMFLNSVLGFILESFHRVEYWKSKPCDVNAWKIQDR